jgi:hypothetical protein
VSSASSSKVDEHIVTLAMFTVAEMTAPKECGSDAREKIRQLLNREKVKLWLPPYTMEDGQKGVYPSVGY